MKKCIIIIIICVQANKLHAQMSAYDSIKVLNLDHYAILPIDSLLQVIPKSYVSIDIIGSLKNNNANGLSIYYLGEMNIWIRPKAYNYMTRSDPNRTWNLLLMKKETASRILVIHPDLPALYSQ